VRALAIGVASVAVLSWVGPAVAGTGRVGLRAVVQPTCLVEISRQEIAIDLRGNVTLVPVARVREQCNVDGGYTVTIVSQNGGVMRRTEGAGFETIGYTVSYDGQSAEAGEEIRIERGPGARGRSGDVLVSVPPGSNGSGVYRDVLIVTVRAR